MKKKFTLADYAEMDKDNLTYQDALDDEEFQHKYTHDKDVYFTLSQETVRSLLDLTGDELKCFVQAVYDDFIDHKHNEVLNSEWLAGLDRMVRGTIRQALETHALRVGGDMKKKYRSFVSGKKGAYERYVKETKTTDDEPF